VSFSRNFLNSLKIYHIQGTEISPLDGGHDNARDFKITAYIYICSGITTSPKRFPLANIISSSICVIQY